MEQRIDALEDEFKVLKSQIKAVLLDIKEYLATGNGHDYAPAREDNKPAAASPERDETKQVQTSATEESQPGPPPNRGLESAAVEQAQPSQDSVTVADQAVKVDPITVKSGGESRVVDLLTVSVVAQWLSRAISTMGKNQLVKLIEIYDATGNLDPRLRDTMLLLTDLCGEGSQSEDAPETDCVPAAVSVQLLIELDGLLRYRNDALESVVLSQLMDSSLGGRKDRYG
jgi:hypothetical protein